MSGESPHESRIAVTAPMLATDVGIDHVVVDLRARKNALGMDLFDFQLFSLKWPSGFVWSVDVDSGAVGRSGLKPKRGLQPTFE